MMTKSLEERIGVFKNWPKEGPPEEPEDKEAFIFFCGVVFQRATQYEPKGFQAALKKAINMSGLHYEALQWAKEIYEVNIPWTDDSLEYEFCNRLRVFGGLPEKAY